MNYWNPLIWILAVVAIVLIVLLLVGAIHAGAMTPAAWSAAP